MQCLLRSFRPLRLHSLTALGFLLAAAGARAATETPEATQYPAAPAIPAKESPMLSLALSDSADARGDNMTPSPSDSRIALLPPTLSPMENLFWSEKGAMRRWFDFPLTEEGRKEELKLRRTMLSLHQVGGYVTLAALIATIFLGEKVYGGDEDLGEIHGAVAASAIASYFATAGLAVFTPPPLVRRSGWSTVSTHKLLATLHFTGMVLTPFLGRQLADGDKELRDFHRASAYITTAAFAGALLVVTF